MGTKDSLYMKRLPARCDDGVNVISHGQIASSGQVTHRILKGRAGDDRRNAMMWRKQ